MNPTESDVRETMDLRKRAEERSVFARGRVPPKGEAECSHHSGKHIPRDCQPWPELGEGMWMATCLWCRTSYALKAEHVPDRYVALEELSGRIDPSHGYRDTIRLWMKGWGLWSHLTEDTTRGDG